MSYEPSDREKHLLKLFRMDVSKLIINSEVESERIEAIRTFHEMELDREYRGKGYRVWKWYPDEFVEWLHGRRNEVDFALRRATEVLGNEEAARSWLSTSQRALGDITPPIPTQHA